jgi:5'-methylthioadenosine phosphorylase
VVQQPNASVAVIGGSGLYSLADTPIVTAIDTPYGQPSGPIATGVIDGVSVAFLPRHGPSHTLPPHRINHRANLWALQSIGVQRVIAPSAVGSLRVDMAPGQVVVCDQFIDHTGAIHPSTFFDGPEVAHVSLADPYCNELRPLASDAGRAAGFTVHDRGTVVVVPGPRFSTRAESRRFRAEGGDVINMTQFPEVALARELGMCYVNLSLVTDYDAGIEDAPDVGAVTQQQVMAEFSQHVATLRGALEQLAGHAGGPRRCACAAMRAVPLGH